MLKVQDQPVKKSRIKVQNLKSKSPTNLKPRSNKFKAHDHGPRSTYSTVEDQSKDQAKILQGQDHKI